MTFQPGQSGNPGGRLKEKPFRDALRLAITDAEGSQKKLRLIAARSIAHSRAISRAPPRARTRGNLAWAGRADASARRKPPREPSHRRDVPGRNGRGRGRYRRVRTR